MTTVAPGPADSLPRVGLGVLPTPLQDAPRLSEELGVEVLLKRDDLTGFGLGGNKVRGLEFLLGDALERGCDVLVTGAGPQSNWAFLAALAARRCGLDRVLCFYGPPPPAAQGNLLLQGLTGARIHFTGDKDRASVDRMIEQVATALRREGRSPLVLPRGGATGLGSIGYVVAAREIADQAVLRGRDAAPPVWLATGSCGTQGGLVVGAAAGWLGRVTGVTVSRPVAVCADRVRDLGTQAAAIAGLDAPGPDHVDVRGGWTGLGYGIASAEGAAAADLVARTEGLLLDPVFAAKAMAGLVDAARAGAVEGPVVFLVSGGAPTLFAQDGGP